MECDETRWRKKFEGPSASPNDRELLDAIQTNLGHIDALAGELDWEEDAVYRYYSQSFKVFGLQKFIERARALFERIARQGTRLSGWFLAILHAALEHEFSIDQTKFDMHQMTRIGRSGPVRSWRRHGTALTS